jgi:hypothetical protein
VSQTLQGNWKGGCKVLIAELAALHTWVELSLLANNSAYRGVAGNDA